MGENRRYDHEYKVQAVKLAKEIGQAKAARELGIPKNTIDLFGNYHRACWKLKMLQIREERRPSFLRLLR